MAIYLTAGLCFAVALQAKLELGIQLDSTNYR